MKEVSWQNLMMMNVVIPTPKDKGTGGSESQPSSLSLFDVGKRLQEGKGVS